MINNLYDQHLQCILFRHSITFNHIFYLQKKIIMANMYTIRIIVNMFFYPILLEIGIENVQFLTMKIIDILLQSIQNNN